MLAEIEILGNGIFGERPLLDVPVLCSLGTAIRAARQVERPGREGEEAARERRCGWCWLGILTHFPPCEHQLTAWLSHEMDGSFEAKEMTTGMAGEPEKLGFVSRDRNSEKRNLQ